jgi:proteasome lid subunit RPN8/RPN11
MGSHADQCYPEECCGLLLGDMGTWVAGQRTREIADVMPMSNRWSPDGDHAHVLEGFPSASAGSVFNKRRRYWIEPADLLAAQRGARDRNLAIIGIYHSHPDHSAEPSECDRTWAWPEYSYIILAVDRGKTVAMKSWRLDEDTHQFRPELLILPSASSPLIADGPDVSLER